MDRVLALQTEVADAEYRTNELLGSNNSNCCSCFSTDACGDEFLAI